MCVSPDPALPSSSSSSERHLTLDTWSTGSQGGGGIVKQVSEIYLYLYLSIIISTFISEPTGEPAPAPLPPARPRPGR